MINSEQLLQHWISCQTPSDLRYDGYIEQGRLVANKYADWELADVSIDEILNYKDSALETSGPLVDKINRFLFNLRNVNDLPPVVLIPVDRTVKKPFIEHKYDNPSLKWEIADGVHRVHLLISLGLNKVTGYIPRGCVWAD